MHLDNLVYDNEHYWTLQSFYFMSYIDALYKKDEDKVYVVERNLKNERVFTEYDARYVFYYPDNKGKHSETSAFLTCLFQLRDTPDHTPKFKYIHYWQGPRAWMCPPCHFFK